MNSRGAQILVALLSMAVSSLKATEPDYGTSTVEPLNVRDFGAVGDCETDDHVAFQAAQAANDARDGGTIFVPWTSSCYRIGDGTNQLPGSLGTGIIVGSRTHWQGENRVRLLVGAMADQQDRNILFNVRSARDVEIAGFTFDGQATKPVDRYYQAVQVSGVSANVAIHDFRAENFANFAITYGEPSGQGGWFDGLSIYDFEIGGVTGLVGTGSGINIFPRTSTGSAPASRNLAIFNGIVDVTNGFSNVVDHGPQGIKINNVDGVLLDGLRLRGGSVGNLVITNGTRNVTVRAAMGAASNYGLHIGTNSNIVNTRTQNVHVADWTYDLDGVAGGARVGLRLQGALRDLRIDRATLNGAGWRIKDSYISDRALADGHGAGPRDWSVGTIDIAGGNIVVEAATDARQPPLHGLSVDSIHISGAPGTNDGRIVLNGWTLGYPRIGSIEFTQVNGAQLTTSSVGGTFERVTSVDGNPGGLTNSFVVHDLGTGNRFGRIEATGLSNGVTHFFSKVAGSGASIELIAGEAANRSGLRVLNQIKGLITGSARSVEALTLAGPPKSKSIFTATDAAYFVTSIRIVYTHGASAESGIPIRVGTMTVPAAFLDVMSDPAAVAGSAKDYVNSSELGSRKVERGESIVVSTPGLQAGAGRVHVVVHVVRLDS